MATLNPFDLLDNGAEDPSQIAVFIAADKPKKPAPVSAVSAKSSAPSRQLAQPGVSKPLYEKRSVYGGARRGGGRRGEAGDGERPRRTFEGHSGTGREGDIKSEEAGCGYWGTPEKKLLLETEEVAGVEAEASGDEVLLMLTRRTPLKWRSRKSRRKGCEHQRVLKPVRVRTTTEEEVVVVVEGAWWS
ncbi:hypothetical protein Bca52824_037735 [Brassica carinata]|uniref:Hyaluronan/mRNA-binding protein domain-containing protein n=1 Tax=Brassica carinata TaxID=52824 RepID=A0A8X7UWG5_BRACI|nr:hypothetical protein Bca52824_037735 [Brassica carinata]